MLKLAGPSGVDSLKERGIHARFAVAIHGDMGNSEALVSPMLKRRRLNRHHSPTPPIASKAQVDGSGTPTISMPQLFSVAPLAAETSARNNVHSPLAFRSSNVPRPAVRNVVSKEFVG